MRIAVIGFGGVGKAFVKLVHTKKEYLLAEGIDAKINYIIGRNGGVYNPEGIDLQAFNSFIEMDTEFTNYQEKSGFGKSSTINFEMMLLNNDVDVVVELTPTNKETGEPGMTHITRSLEHGINVITANKGPIMLAYKHLIEIATSRRVQLGIGCTTGGALPSINGGIIDMAGAEIMSIEGILNGTTNYIINEMETSGVDYKTALQKAQKLGIAEADPTLDVEGWDTAGKLLILTNALMHTDKVLADITVEGITKLTPKQVMKSLAEGKKYKLMGKTVSENGKLVMTVGLEALNSSHPLYGVDGKNKAVRYKSDVLGDLTMIGGASGVVPAAASVLRDLVNINRGYKFSR